MTSISVKYEFFCKGHDKVQVHAKKGLHKENSSGKMKFKSTFQQRRVGVVRFEKNTKMSRIQIESAPKHSIQEKENPSNSFYFQTSVMVY